jgi:hypothetical protein
MDEARRVAVRDEFLESSLKGTQTQLSDGADTPEGMGPKARKMQRVLTYLGPMIGL